MAKAPAVVVKNIHVSPHRVPNNGSGKVRVSAMVFTPVDEARINEVAVEVPFLQEGSRVAMAFHEAEGITASREGVYSCSFDIPLLADPGEYALPIMATDAKGTTGTGYGSLRVEYRSPAYSGTITSPSHQHTLDRISGSPATGGNRVEALVNGDESLEKRISLIQMARTQINLQTYALSADGRCGRLVDALLEKATQGVQVNLILNMTSQLVVSPLTAVRFGLQKVGKDLQDLAKEVDETLEGRQGIQEMLKDVQNIFQRLGRGPHGANVILADEVSILGEDRKGLEVGRRSRKWLEKMASDQKQLTRTDRKRMSEWYMGFKGPGGLPALPLLTYAVHEKMMVVDGNKAIVGGRNLEDRYFTHWIDKDVYLEGPVVRNIQEGFSRTWESFCRNLKREVTVAPLLETLGPAGDIEARFVQSRPWMGEYATLENLVTAIQMAKKRICASSQYLVLPDSLLRDALLDAARRGVEVHILMNSYTTGQEVGFSGGYLVSLNYCEALIEAGIRIYEINGPTEEEMPKPYLHVKEFLIDGLWAAIGSFNLSIRSCYIESENLVNIHDPDFVQAQEEIFWNRVRKDATEITREYLKEQREKFRGKLAMARYLDLFY